MLKTLRNPKYVRTIMLWTLILIIPAFVLFYGWSSFTGDKSDQVSYATKINGKEITPVEFQKEYTQMMDQLRKMYGDKFDESMAIELNLAGQVMEEMENRELLLEQARKMGILVSDNEINVAIRYNQSFMQNGQFNKMAYQQQLAAKGLSPEEFEHQLRIERTLTRLQHLVTDYVKVSETEIREEYRKNFEQMVLEFVRFATPDYIGKVAVTESEAKDFYGTHQREYQIPPHYQLQYVAISPKEFMGTIQVSDKDIKDYYDSEMSSFAVPERAHLKQIVALVPQGANQQVIQASVNRIKQAMTRLAAKESFEKVAKELSQDPTAKNGGTVGWITSGEGNAEYEKLVFSLPIGQPSQVLQMQDGFHIVMVDQKEASRIKTLDEVKPQVIETLKNLAAETSAQAKCEILLDAYKGTEKLSDLAAKSNLSVSNTDWVNAKTLPILADNKEFISVLATLTPGKINGPFKSQDTFYVVQLIAKQESRIPKFEEIQDKVKAQLMFQKAQEASLKAAEASAKELQSGKTLEEVAAQNAIKIGNLGPITVASDIPGLGKASPLAVTAFYLPPGKTSSVVTVKDPMGQGFVQYFIIRLKARSGINEADLMEKKEQLSQAALNQKRQEAFSEYIQSLRKKAKIERSKTFLEGFQKTEPTS